MATKVVYEDGDDAESERLIAGAIKETEEEIAREAFDDQEPENDGDTSLEQMENQEGDPIDDAGETEEEDEPEDDLYEADETLDALAAETTQPERRGDPAVALRQERAARRKLETDLAEMRGRLEEIGRRPATPVEKVEPVERPDPLINPKDWEKTIREEIRAEYRQEQTTARVEMTFADVHEAHGKDFDFAYQQLQEVGRQESAASGKSKTVISIINAPNPGKALMKWAERKLAEGREARLNDARQTLIDAGVDAADVDAILERRQGEQPSRQAQQANRGRREARQSTGDRREAIHETRRPVRLPSLNSATGSAPQRQNDARGLDGSEEAIFAYAFEK